MFEGNLTNAKLVVLDNSVLKADVNETVNITADLTTGGLYVVKASVNLTVDGYDSLVATDCGNGTYWAEFKADFTGVKEVFGNASYITNLEVLEGAIDTEDNGSIISENLTKYYGDGSDFVAVLFGKDGALLKVFMLLLQSMV